MYFLFNIDVRFPTFSRKNNIYYFYPTEAQCSSLCGFKYIWNIQMFCLGRFEKRYYVGAKNLRFGTLVQNKFKEGMLK